MARKDKPIKAAKVFDQKGMVARTNDGFENFAARLGVSASKPNNSLSFGTYLLNLVTRNRIKLEAAYRGSWVVGQIIDAPADDMTRAGIELTTSKKSADVNKIKIAMSKLQIWQSLNSVIKWGRLYGGSIGVMDIEGQDRSTPLDPETVGKGQFKGIIPYDRWQLNPDLTNVIQDGPDMGLPEFYYITTDNDINDPANQDVEGGLKVHYSRVVRYIGYELPFFQAITEMMWGESIVERVFDRLISFDSTTMSTANLVERACNRTVSVDGLREIVAAGGKPYEGLLAQMEMMREFQTNEGLTLIDKEDLYQTDQYTFAGLDSVLLGFAQQLSGASQIPLVRLFSQTPTGMNATGDADIRMYYDSINAQQEARLRNPIEMILTVLYRSEFGTSRPDDLQFTFTPLWQMSEKDKSDVAKAKTEAILGAFESGLISKATALRELKQISDETGLFGNIDEEEISDAEEEPPMPGEIDPSAEGDKPKNMLGKMGDAISRKFKKKSKAK